jgi:hypothetical protein
MDLSYHVTTFTFARMEYFLDVQIETCKNDNKYIITNLLFFLVKHIMKLSQVKTRIRGK